jgi:hypothetical protein
MAPRLAHNRQPPPPPLSLPRSRPAGYLGAAGGGFHSDWRSRRGRRRGGGRGGRGRRICDHAIHGAVSPDHVHRWRGQGPPGRRAVALSVAPQRWWWAVTAGIARPLGLVGAHAHALRGFQRCGLASQQLHARR